GVTGTPCFWAISSVAATSSTFSASTTMSGVRRIVSLSSSPYEKQRSSPTSSFDIPMRRSRSILARSIAAGDADGTLVAAMSMVRLHLTSVAFTHLRVSAKNIDFRRFSGTKSYLTNEALEAAVNCALALERPLLIKGEPGTGKTLLAQAVAESLGLELLF